MKTKICVGGFLVKKKKFLFCKRSEAKSWAPGKWDIVGGRSLKNEHPFYTLQRETREEIGVTILNAELLKSVEVMEKKKQGFFTYHIYMVTHYKGKPANCSKEHTKIRWFTREELNEVSLALPEYLTIIDEWMALPAKSANDGLASLG